MMQVHNGSGVDYLFLQGISYTLAMQIPLFIVFLLIYLTTITGNLSIFIVICLDTNLHKPMYFFLCNLAFIDTFFASIIQPKLLSIHLMGNLSISFTGCFTQFSLYLTLVTAEFLCLTIMSYDRFVAICKPLHYSRLMSNRMCILLAAICWIAGLLEPVSHVVVMTKLPYCNVHIGNFYCDYSALLQLYCVETTNIELMTLVAAIVVAIPAFLLTVSSYIYIISTVMKMHSSEGRLKLFSTCAPHLTVITLYYSTVTIRHLMPSGNHPSIEGKLISVLYTIVIPLANPFIFTLKNREVKQSLFDKLIKRIILQTCNS